MPQIARTQSAQSSLTVKQRWRVPGFAFTQMTLTGGFANYQARSGHLELPAAIRRASTSTWTPISATQRQPEQQQFAMKLVF